MAFVENEDAQTPNQLITSNGQASLYINRKQVLSATFLKNDVALYKFVQQPAMMKKPLNMPNNIKADAGKDEMALVAYTKFQEIPMMPMPLSQVLINKEEVMMNQEEPSTLEEGHHLAFAERKKNWIIRSRPRQDGNKTDLYFVHLQTDIQFRSLSDVYKFVVHGRLPPSQRARKAMRNTHATASSDVRRVRGDKLLKKTLMGQYNHTKKEILRTETPPVGEICPSGSFSTSIDKEDKKRKREDETTAPQEGLTNMDPGETVQLVYDLYDFEPAH